MVAVDKKELQESVARFSLDEYPYLDCQSLRAVSIGKQELMDLRVIARAYLSGAAPPEKEQMANGWHVQEDEGWFY